MDTETPFPAASDSVASRPLRKAKPPVIEKIATLEMRLAAARAEAREAARAQATIVGTAVISAMRDDPEFARTVIGQLKMSVTGARDRAAIASLLI